MARFFSLSVVRVGLGISCLLLLSPLFSAQARATQGCYSIREAEAEQGIRIHSELMVIGLNCQHMTPQGKENLYSQYRKFTSSHATIFSSYEDVLIDFFRRSGDANPEGALHDLRTAFANKISTDAAQMRPDVFCRHFSERIEVAASMNDGDIKRWAATFYPSHPVSYPICEQ